MEKIESKPWIYIIVMIITIVILGIWINNEDVEINQVVKHFLKNIF